MHDAIPTHLEHNMIRQLTGVKESKEDLAFKSILASNRKVRK
jgi:hypothetical protein